jgi:protein-tyrosine phosphatase
VSVDDVRADELPTMQFGVYTVYFKQQTVTPLWTVRTFDLQRDGVSFPSLYLFSAHSLPSSSLSFQRVISVHLQEGRMSITQYHYTSWPDHGVPAEPTDLLHFREAVRTTPTSGPLLVHCSAGVGRSGTFIATDHMLNLVQVRCCNSF